MKKSSVLKGIGLGVGAIILVLLGVVIGSLIVDHFSLSAKNADLEVSINELKETNKSLEDENQKLSKEQSLLKEKIQIYEKQLAEEEQTKADQEALKEENEAKQQEYKERLATNLVRVYLEGAGYVPKHIEVDHMEGDIYVVHAYDVMEYPGEVGHTATVGWYDVDVETMNVDSMF